MDDTFYETPLERQELNIQPPASIYGTYARLNYKMWYAIAEFVDNSTASFWKNERSLSRFAREKQLHVDIVYDSNAGTLTISDNAYGMELPDFKRAILLNSKPENRDGRNEFGMGLKTAASWFGKKWTVISTQFGSKNSYRATVDIPHLEEAKVNTVEIETYPASPDDHGTTIIISHLNRRIEGPKTIAKIKDTLRSMYRRDLESGQIKITYNHDELRFKPYEVLVYKDKEWRENLDFSFEFNGITHRITGFAALLGPNDSGFKKAGFALFRRNRVVIGAEGDYYKPLRIFGEAQSKVSHKLFGELDLEDFEINQAKDGFVWDDGLEDKFVEELRNRIQEYIRLASKTVKERENAFDPSNRKQIEATQTIVQESFDRLGKKTDQTEQSSAPSFSSKTDAEIEYENLFGVNSPEPPEEAYEETRNVYRIPGFGQEDYRITTTWTGAGTKYWFEFDKENNDLKININHPFFQPFTNSPDFRNIINKFVIAIIVAEKRAQFGQEKPGFVFVDDVNNAINDILKEIA